MGNACGEATLEACLWSLDLFFFFCSLSIPLRFRSFPINSRQIGWDSDSFALVIQVTFQVLFLFLLNLMFLVAHTFSFLDNHTAMSLAVLLTTFVLFFTQVSSLYFFPSS